MSPDPAAFPGLNGRHVRLRPLLDADVPWLYDLATRDDVTYRWRLRGATPNPDAFKQMIWHETVTQMVLESRDRARPVGLVQLVNPDLRNSFAYLSVLIDPNVMRSGWPFEGVFLFINYVFRLWNFRKLYVETSEIAIQDFQSATDTLLTTEGTLLNHEFYDGRYLTTYILACYRSTWEANRDLVEKMLDQ